MMLKRLSTYIDSEWIFSKVFVLHIIKVHGVRIKAAEAFLLEPLLELSDAPGGHAEVAQEADEHDRLGVGFAQPVADHVPEEDHHPILLVVLWVEGVFFVDASTAEDVVEETL